MCNAICQVGSGGVLSLILLLFIANDFQIALTIRLVYYNETHVKFLSNESSSVPSVGSISENTSSAAEENRDRTSKAPTTTAKLAWPDLSCDFDSFTTCGWKNPRIQHRMDDFDWHTGRGKDAHRRKTGTKTDHCGGGGYLYIRSGNYRNRTAKILSNFFVLPSSGCMKFWYHMRGKHMGHLKLYESEDLQGRIQDTMIQDSPLTLSSSATSLMKYNLLWAIYGSQGGQWQEGVVPVLKTSYRRLLVFEAFDWDKGRQGNILIDDITFEPASNNIGGCILSPSDAAPPTKEPQTTQQKLTTTELTTHYVALTTTVTATTQTHTPTANYTVKTTTLQAPSTAVIVTKPVTPSVSSSQTAEQTTSRQKQTTEANATAAGVGINVKSVDGRTKIYTAVAVVGLFLILVMSLLCYVRYRRRRRFSYYDNCTVAMTRMTPEIVKIADHSMEYRKLT